MFQLNIELSTDKDIKYHYELIFQLLCNHFVNLIGEPPLGYRKLNIKFGDKVPMALYLTEQDSDYTILLKYDNVEWYNQAVYQFGHELCHLFCFHRDYKIQVNNWLIESICEMSSLYCLELISDKQPQNKTYFQNYRDKFSTNLTEEELNNLIRNDYPPNTQYCRTYNRFVAFKLLMLFQDDIKFWKILKYLPEAIKDLDTSTNNSFENSTVDFDKLNTITNKELSKQIIQLRSIFEDRK